ncbi:MAG: response regulator, partial [Burkholderiales bacterium]|nr:response regulator [Burkholderiales bacterium]
RALAAQRAADEQAAAEAASRPTRVLVVDDSRVVRVKTGRLLAQHGFEVSDASDGLEAERRLQADLPDLIITDVEMPGMDGFALTRSIRAAVRTAHIPVIMITAADDRHRTDAAEAGVSALLGKPYGDDALIAQIRQLVPGAAPQRVA